MAFAVGLLGKRLQEGKRTHTYSDWIRLSVRQIAAFRFYVYKPKVFNGSWNTWRISDSTSSSLISYFSDMR